MKYFSTRLFWGALLVLGGILILLANLDVLELPVSAIWIVFALVGIVFTFSFITNSRSMWWAAIPGLIFLALAVIIGFDDLPGPFGSDLSAFLILGAVGMAFLLIRIVQPGFWWAVIPAGVNLTIAVVTLIPEFAGGEFTAVVLFLGFAATFGLLALLPSPAGRMRWPLIPAGVMLLVALIIFSASTNLFRFIWPVLLILAGLFIFFRRAR